MRRGRCAGCALGAAALVLAMAGCTAPDPGADRGGATEPISSFELDADGLTVHSRADSELRRVTFDEGAAPVVAFLTRYLGEPRRSVPAGCVGVEDARWPTFGFAVRTRTAPSPGVLSPVTLRIELPGAGDPPVLVTTPGELALGDASTDLEHWRAAVPERDRIDTDGGLSLVVDPLDRDEHIRDGAIADLDEDGRIVAFRSPTSLEEPTC